MGPSLQVPSVMETEREAQRGEVDVLFARFARTGEPALLGEVYDRLAPELLGLALHLARDAAEAEDVLQATFVTALERASSFDPSRRVLPWFVGILGHEARRARLRSGRRPDPERLAGATSCSPELEAERAELLERLEATLARLPEAFRAVLVLRLRHGLTVPEIAQALGRPPGTVRSQLARGTEVLRRALPAGLAGALVLLCVPTRGLAAVRDAVVARASALHAPWTAVFTRIGGALLVKKLVALAAVLVVALSLVWWNRLGASAPAPVIADAPSAASELDPAPPVPPSPPPASERAAVEPYAPAPALVAAATPTGAALLVRARWPDGEPAAGEVVLVTPNGGRLDASLPAPTDAAGEARFEGLPRGPAHVRLLRGAENDVFLAEGETRTLTLRVKDGVRVAGRVLDGAGAPVAGALVRVSERYRTDLGHTVASTDADGRFEVACIGPDHYLSAEKAGFAPSGQRIVRGAAGERQELVLVLDRAGAGVRGRVLDRDGAPVPDALVLLGEERPPYDSRADDGAWLPAGAPRRATSDADGRFALDCAPLGRQPVQARAPGFGPFAGECEVVAGGPNELVLTLAPEARVVGRVLDARGEGLACVNVTSDEDKGFAAASTWSGLDGSYELTGLGAGSRTVVARHAEQGEARIELGLTPGETRRWEAHLAPTLGLRGRVVDAHGAPVEGAVVIALPDGAGGPRVRSGQSDADGRFALPELEDEPQLLWVQGPTGWRGFPWLELEDVRPSPVELELRLPDLERERARLTAEVVGPDGAPLVGAELQVWHDGRRLWRSFENAEPGRFLVADVPPGAVDLELRHASFPWVRLGRRELVAGETLDLGRIELAPGGSLRVHLTGLARERLAALHTVLADPNNREGGVLRLVEDELVSGPLAPGAHTLRVGGDFVRDEVRTIVIRPGIEERLEIALAPCGLRRARFTLPAGAAAPRWLQATLHGRDGGPAVWAGPAEALEARVSAPVGEYLLIVGGEGGLGARGPFSIGRLDGAEPPLEFSLAPRE